MIYRPSDLRNPAPDRYHSHRMMNRRHVLELSLLSGTSVLLGWKLLAAPVTHGELAAYIRQMEIIRPLFTAKGAPQPDDWLAAHKESGQTFAQYRASDPNRPTKERKDRKSVV